MQYVLLQSDLSFAWLGHCSFSCSLPTAAVRRKYISNTASIFTPLLQVSVESLCLFRLSCNDLFHLWFSEVLQTGKPLVRVKKIQWKIILQCGMYELLLFWFIHCPCLCLFLSGPSLRVKKKKEVGGKKISLRASFSLSRCVLSPREPGS